jgi:hypothetical protein
MGRASLFYRHALLEAIVIKTQYLKWLPSAILNEPSPGQKTNSQ